MKITKRQLRRLIREAQWGNFTGGARPLDEPPLDSGMMDPEQQQKVFDILVDTGSDPKKLLASGEFPDVVTESVAGSAPYSGPQDVVEQLNMLETVFEDLKQAGGNLPAPMDTRIMDALEYLEKAMNALYGE